MRKIVLLSLLHIVSVLHLSAQHAGFKVINDETDFKKNYASAAGSIQTIKCDFVQEKNLSMLSEKIISKGNFLFKKQTKVKMEYTKPYRYLLIINGDKVMLKDEQKSNTFFCISWSRRYG